jgi:hypothetical protein
MTNEVISTLNDLVETSRDGESGFHAYALMRHVRLATMLAVTTAASLVGASATQSNGVRAARPTPTCHQFWQHGSSALVSLPLDE